MFTLISEHNPKIVINLHCKPSKYLMCQKKKSTNEQYDKIEKNKQNLVKFNKNGCRKCYG